VKVSCFHSAVASLVSGSPVKSNHAIVSSCCDNAVEVVVVVRFAGCARNLKSVPLDEVPHWHLDLCRRRVARLGLGVSRCSS